MKKNKTGLILCKLAPMHIGHQYLIETALKEVDKLIVLVYDCPDKTKIPLNVRAKWVRALYPNVSVIEGWDAPNKHEDTPEVKRLQEKYVSDTLGGVKITHFISSEYYGEHMSKHLDAINRIVDMDRIKYQISSTMVRGDLNSYKKMLPALVLKDLLVKVALIGIPSRENERIIKELSKIMSTTYFENNLLKVTGKDTKSKTKVNYLKIAREKKNLRNQDNKLYAANRVLFYDSSTLVDHVLSVGINRGYDEDILAFAGQEMRLFDLIFLNKTIKLSERNYNGISGEFLENQLIANLNSMKLKYTVLDGSFYQKVDKIKRMTISYLKKNRI